MSAIDKDTLHDLERLARKLTVVAMDECDPRNWTGHGVPMVEQDAKTRGDRAYDKKNAGLTVSLLTKVHALIAIHTPQGKALATLRAAEDKESVDELLKEAQKQAEEIKRRIEDGTYNNGAHIVTKAH